MERKYLESLGIEKETIDKIMAENGKDIAAEQAKTTAMTTERDTLQTQLADANKTIKGYKDMDIEAVKQSAVDWEQKAKDNAKELDAVRQEAALDKALAGTTTIDADLLKKALDPETLSYKDGKFVGLDEQVKQLQKDKPYLFKPEEEKKPEGAGDGNKPNSFEPYVPKGSDNAGASTMSQQIDAVFSNDAMF